MCLNHHQKDDRLCGAEFFACRIRPGQAASVVRIENEEYRFAYSDQVENYRLMSSHYRRRFPGGIDAICGYGEAINTSFLQEAAQRATFKAIGDVEADRAMDALADQRVQRTRLSFAAGADKRDCASR